MNPKFEVEFLPEAIEFLDNLEEKAREKVYYNIKKTQYLNDNELFKKSVSLFGNFVLYSMEMRTDYFHFGIILMVKRLWL